jgi:hypothetical protein
MWINKFGILAINQKSPKDITEGILFLFNCIKKSKRKRNFERKKQIFRFRFRYF